jgi:hypothetical protein
MRERRPRICNAESLARRSPAGGAGKGPGVAGNRPTAAKMADGLLCPPTNSSNARASPSCRCCGAPGDNGTMSPGAPKKFERTAPADNANPFSRMLRVHSTPPNGRPDDVLDRDLSRPLDGLKLSSSCAMVGVTRKVRAKLAPRREQSMRRRPPYSGWFVKLWQRSSV